MKKLSLLIVLGLSLSIFTACEEDEPKKESFKINCETFATEDYKVILEDLEAKGKAYGEDPSKENCEAYYESLETYITTWKKYVDTCVPEAAAQLEFWWSTYQSYLDDLTCE